MTETFRTIQYEKGKHIAVSRHFTSSEFDCPCTECGFTLITLELVAALERLRNSIGQAITITSGYRCDAHQNALREAGKETSRGISQHELGNAADVISHGKTGQQIEDAARSVGIMCVGVGKEFAHLDLRFDKVRRWEYGNP